MPDTLLTDVGQSKITLAAGDASAVAICEVALGDGLGAPYAPSHDQTALKRELARRAIDVRHVVDPNAWRIKVEFPPETPAFSVREIGFLDEDGDLVAIWAGIDIDARQTGAISYLIDQVLSFDRVAEGAVIVDAPDDELFNFLVSQITMNFRLGAEQIRQALKIHALEGGG